MHFCYVSRYISRYISFWTTRPRYLGWFSVSTSVRLIQDFRFLEICQSCPVPRFQRSVPDWSRGQTGPRLDCDLLLLLTVVSSTSIFYFPHENPSTTHQFFH